MWTTILAALISALAALGGVIISSYITSKNLRRTWENEREKKFIEDRLETVGKIVSLSSRIRIACLPRISKSPPEDFSENEDLLDFQRELDALTSRLRLTVDNFATASAAIELFESTRSCVSIAREPGPLSEEKRNILTLLLASQRMREEGLVSLARSELGIGEVKGMPKYDAEVIIKALLQKTLKGEGKVEETYEKIMEVQRKKKDSEWLAK
ncbi:hypothetical protein NE857_30530 [Nocardiopsis exhalans]|uniref:Uncharacterized protein n=1 Tax=Nocardiopsis exhalans TaxID=163604 RepID=A0ABY5D8U0_9ACTN|nr:hypothetical protein [Nocardiopsis exhalans]USY19526.1 hypothetical protein NE857_30530 [Nocardiopsis exhalans]